MCLVYFTEKQLLIINFIRDFIKEKGVSPTLEEIAQYFKVSKITIYEHIAALEKKGALRKSRFKVPVLGRIAAGCPIEAVEEAEEFDLSSLFPDNKECFLLRVKGDSMIEDQIRDGDLVLVEKRQQPLNGEIVVAIVNGNEATLKRFFREKSHVRLQPANSKMSPIYTDEVEVRGVVIGVLRRF
jgi:repressor LexA